MLVRVKINSMKKSKRMKQFRAVVNIGGCFQGWYTEKLHCEDDGLCKMLRVPGVHLYFFMSYPSIAYILLYVLCILCMLEHLAKVDYILLKQSSTNMSCQLYSQAGGRQENSIPKGPLWLEYEIKYVLRMVFQSGV